MNRMMGIPGILLIGHGRALLRYLVSVVTIINCIVEKVFRGRDFESCPLFFAWDNPPQKRDDVSP